MTIVFKNSSPKLHKNDIFGTKFRLFFHKILELDKFEGGDFKHCNSFLKFQPKITQKWHFRFQLQAFLRFRKIFQFVKFEAADLKYGNSFSKFQPKYVSIRHFWSQIQAICFQRNFPIWEISRSCYKYDNSFLILYPKNTQIRHFQFQIQLFLFFLQNFPI